MARWLAIVLSMLLVVVVGIGLAWVFSDLLFGNLGSVGKDISEGADKVVTWLRDNDDWAKQHEQGIRDFRASILPAAKHAAGGILKGALGGLSFAAGTVSGALLVLVFLLYIITSGDSIWEWIRGRFSPSAASASLLAVARPGWPPAATSAASA